MHSSFGLRFYSIALTSGKGKLHRSCTNRVTIAPLSRCKQNKLTKMLDSLCPVNRQISQVIDFKGDKYAVFITRLAILDIDKETGPGWSRACLFRRKVPLKVQ